MRTLATAFATCLLIAPTAVSAQLDFSPSSLNFNVAFGSGTAVQNVCVSFNRSPPAITSVSATTTTGQPWLQPFLSGAPGIVTVAVNPVVLSAGSYTGTASVFTTVGSGSFQVDLNVGGGTPPGIPEPPSSILTLTGLAGAGLYQARRIFAR